MTKLKKGKPKLEDEDLNNEQTIKTEPKNDDDNKIESKYKKARLCCKKFSKFLFSHIGLVTMVVLYTCAGAFLFELLEQHEEVKDCQEGKSAESSNIISLKSQLLSYIQFNMSSNPSDTSKDNETVASQKIEQWLTEFRTQTLEIRTKYRYHGQNCNFGKWNFAGALLFAITIITTIGYGHITPFTWEGQIVCICYATIGIPLFLMCIANISGVLGDMFRYVYSRICCGLCARISKNNKDKSEELSVEEISENATKNTMETEVIETSSNQISSQISPSASVKEKKNASDTSNDVNKNSNNISKIPNILDDLDDLEIEDDRDENRITVPLTITMIIITLYVIIGAVIFNQFEGWSLIQAGYFCYITLATIGFGDFVPGQNPHDQYAGPKLILCATYVLFGMAILAMCFNLMQEEIIAKFTWLGKKLGLIELEEEMTDESGELLEQTDSNIN